MAQFNRTILSSAPNPDNSPEKRNKIILWSLLGVMTGMAIAAIGFSISAIQAKNQIKPSEQEARHNEVNALLALSESEFKQKNRLDALLIALRAASILQDYPDLPNQNFLQRQLISTLQKSAYHTYEYQTLDKVKQVFLSPNGQTLALLKEKDDRSGSHIQLHDLAGKYLLTLDSSDSMQGVVFSADGQKLATYSNRGQIIIWSLTGEKLYVFNDGEEIERILFSPDGESLAFYNQDRVFTLWTFAEERWSSLNYKDYRLDELTFSPDSQTLALSDGRGDITLWNLAGEKQKTLSHDRELRTMEWSPDGQTLVFSDFEAEMHIWDLADGEVKTLAVDSDVLRIVFSPNGQTFISKERYKDPQLRDLTGKVLRTFEHDDQFYGIFFAPDGQTIISRHPNGHLRAWANSISEPRTVEYNSELYDMIFGTNSRALTLVRDSHYNNIKIRNFVDGNKRILSHKSVDDGLNAFMVLDADGQTIISHSDDGKVKLWDLTFSEWRSLDISHGDEAAVLGADQSILAIGKDDQLSLHGLAGEQELTLDYEDNIDAMVVSPNGQYLLFYGYDGPVKLWDNATETVQTLDVNPIINYNAKVLFSPNSELLAVGHFSGEIQLWNLSENKEYIFDHDYGLQQLTFSADSQVLASRNSQQVKVWQTKGKEIQTSSFNQGITQIALSRDGQTLVVGDEYGQVELRRVDGAEGVIFGDDGAIEYLQLGSSRAALEQDGLIKLEHLDGEEAVVFDHLGAVEYLQLSPDSETLVVHADGEVILWQLETQERKVLQHDGLVNRIGFSSDGQLIAFGTQEGTVTLWNFAGERLYTFDHGDELRGITFSEDNQTVISYNDSNIQWWKLDQDDLVTRGCTWVQDYLVTHPQDLAELTVCQTPELRAESVPYVLRAGEQAASDGDLEMAIAHYELASRWDRNFSIRPAIRAQNAFDRSSAKRSIASGRQLALQGEQERAVLKFQQALWLVPKIDLNPDTEAMDRDPQQVAADLYAASQTE